LVARIDVEGIKETVYILRQAEPELYKQLIKDVKNEPGVASAVQGIRSNIPTVSPLSGMMHNGRTAYTGARASSNFKPSNRLDRGNQRSILTIGATPSGGGVGFEITDLVGRGARGNTAKAQGMKRGLGGSPSRYVWKGFEQRREGVTRAVVSIIDKYSRMVNVKLKVK
jgi:hypothetical protein